MASLILAQRYASQASDILERELQQHAAALRGLARDLVGAGNAPGTRQNA